MPHPEPRLPFDIADMVRRIRRAVQPFPKAAMFELAENGWTTPFQQLCACIISIRTTDEVMIPTALRLFARAATPAQMARLSVEEIDELIHACAFHYGKAGQIREIAQRLVAEHGGELACDEALMLSFRGVGPKCTNLVMGIACGEPRIGVDVHVHRVTNRWGYVATAAPEATLAALMQTLPRRYWVEINRLLVPFGKHICTSRELRGRGCAPRLAEIFPTGRHRGRGNGRAVLPSPRSGRGSRGTGP